MSFSKNMESLQRGHYYQKSYFTIACPVTVATFTLFNIENEASVDIEIIRKEFQMEFHQISKFNWFSQ